MFGSKIAMLAVAVTVIGLAAVPVSMALDDDAKTYDLSSVEGTVKAFVCCDEDCDCDDCDERAGAFMLETDDGEMIRVEFGPWWYWETQEITVRDIIEVGDEVNVTGELVDEDDVTVMEAWVIKNLDTGEDITIKVEGCPPWAGGPIKLGIEPWPPSEEED
ncbi:MAG: hypothetical protein QG582_251 [Candidatus Thermoplasmatota archaeon]|nr:hypothetical protein [Candidatus Thermoplasmatota archaeon]